MPVLFYSRLIFIPVYRQLSHVIAENFFGSTYGNFSVLDKPGRMQSTHLRKLISLLPKNSNCFFLSCEWLHSGLFFFFHVLYLLRMYIYFIAISILRQFLSQGLLLIRSLQSSGLHLITRQIPYCVT